MNLKTPGSRSDVRHLLVFPLSLGCILFDLYLIEQRWRGSEVRGPVWLLIVFGLQSLSQLFAYFLARRETTRLTEHPPELRSFAITSRLAEVVFLACLGQLLLLFYISRAVCF